jgi:hypothetical protein
MDFLETAFAQTLAKIEIGLLIATAVVASSAAEGILFLL